MPTSGDLKFIFFGTPKFAVVVLTELKKAGFLPALVVTAPDRPAGRGLKLTSPPVKIWAETNDILALQPEKLNKEFSYNLSSFARASDDKQVAGYQLGILAAYGKIIPKWLIDYFPRGILNVHPSLLPKYRGPSPVQSQILSDDRDIGVTIMLLDEQMDHGKIISGLQFPIFKLKDQWPAKASVLEEKLACEGGKLLAAILPRWISREIKPRDQDHDRATYTKKINKEDGLIEFRDIQKKPYETFLRIRAFDSWPGTYFFHPLLKTPDGKSPLRIKIKDAVYENGALCITRVIPEGGHEADFKNFSDGIN